VTDSTSEPTGGPTEEPSPKKKVRRKTFGAAMLGAAMVGLDEALNGPKEEPAVVEVGSSGGNDDDPFAVDLDPEDPAQSVAVVRPWLHEP
jgi:hypothetical protein